MADRDAKGRFTAGNEWASKGGRARARALSPQRRREIARMGFAAMVDRHFEGDKKAAVDWLTAKGQWASDAGYREDGLGVFRDPGPHPARRNLQLETVREIAF